MDKVFLREMQFYAYHGAYPEENRLGQRFTVDLELGLDLRRASLNDDLEQTVDYGAVYEVVSNVMQSRPVKLLESLAERVIQRLFIEFPSIETIWIRVTKPDPPIPGHYRAVGVELKRTRHVSDG